MTDTNTAVEVKDVYEDENVLARMKEAYVGAEDNDTARAAVVEQLANELGKSLASIRGKLGSLGVYKAKVVAPKGNGKTKQNLAEEIADLMDVEFGITVADGEVESLAKANKTMLNKLIEALSFEIEFANKAEDTAEDITA